MRTLFLTLLAIYFLLPLTALANDAQEGPDAYAVRGVKADDVLNIRILPDFQSKKVGEIPHNGRGIINHHCVNDVPLSMWLELSEKERENIYQKRWCKIEYQGVTGWVSAQYLKEDSDEEHMIITEDQSAPASSPTPQKTSKRTGDRSDIEELKIDYISYLSLKLLHELANEVPIYGLISDAEMDQAKSSMAYIDDAFKKRHPDFDTEALWQQQMEEYAAVAPDMRVLFAGVHRPTDDMLLTKSGLLQILLKEENHYRTLNGDKKIMKKDF